MEFKTFNIIKLVSFFSFFMVNFNFFFYKFIIDIEILLKGTFLEEFVSFFSLWFGATSSFLFYFSVVVLVLSLIAFLIYFNDEFIKNKGIFKN